MNSRSDLDVNSGTADAARVSIAALSAAAVLSGLSFLFGNTQPVILGAFAEQFELTIDRLGYLASVFLLASGLIKLTAPMWIRKIDQRAICVLGLIGATIAFGSAVWISSYGTLLAAMFAFGLAEGIFGAVSFVVLGDYRNPGRAYGISIAVQMLMAALFLVLATQVLGPSFGYPGVIGGFTVVIASGLLIAKLIPRQSAGNADHPEITPDVVRMTTLLPFIVAVIASMLFLSAIMAAWVFSERFAVEIELSLSFVGWSLALASLMTAVSAFVSAMISGRFSERRIATAGVLILLLSFYVFYQKSSTTFMAGLTLLSFGWGLAQPSFYAFIRRVDPTARLFSVVPAMVNVGIAIGVSVGGIIASYFSFGAMLLTAGATLIASILLLEIASAVQGSLGTI